ncbi:MAG: DUF5698 domain-containing protein [Planctomycetota bacterium]|jgi:uncharacterized protein YebE (UPF0316 family)|nr:DUF5698 domain-containing protein [Planctomycetota bacterium]
MNQEALITVLIIFLARCTDVTMSVFRILMLVKGRKIMAAGLGFFEVMVYILVMNAIMGGGRSLSLPELLAYCSGFAAGNIVGSYLESWLTSGYIMIEIIMTGDAAGKQLADRLHKEGFGATVLNGEGLNGPHLVFNVICRRGDAAYVNKIAREAGGFVFITDLKRVSGGYFRKIKHK